MIPYASRAARRLPLLMPTLLAGAVCHLAPAAATLGAVLLAAPQAAHAQQDAGAMRQYRIPAGPLEAALNRFGREAGILLSFDPALVQGLASPGLDGAYTARAGLQALLRDSELEAVVQREGSYRLQPRAGTPATQLEAVRVVGVTEGTGSYTTNLTNTATKLDLSLRETPQSVTVVTRKRMEDQGLDEITKVLDQTPGVYFHNTNVLGADNNLIYARGFALDNYQVDGIPRSTRFGFQNDIADTAVFDRVEVVRGASGLLNGIGEPSGAVNLVRKLPTRDFQAHLSAKYGSWNYYRAEADVSGPLTESGRIRGRLVGAYQDSDTFADRIGMKKEIVYGVIEADLAPGTILSAGVEYQNHETTGAGGTYSTAPLFYMDGSRTHFSRSTNLAADWANTTRENLVLFANLEHYFENGWRVRLDAEHGRRKYDMVLAGMGWDIMPDGSGSFQAVRWAGRPEQDSLNLHAIGPYRLFGRSHELVVGASYYRMKETGRGYNGMLEPVADFFPIAATGRYPRADMSADGSGYAVHDWQSGAYAATRISPLDGVSVILGSRVSNWKTRRDSHDASGVATRGTTAKETGELTPYAGVVVDLTENLSVYGSYTDIFRPATVYDAGGNLLDPAKGSNLEGGVKLAFLEDRLNISAAYYRTKKDNVPEYVPGPGGSVNFGPNGQYVYEGVDGTKTTGFDLEISGQLTPDWQVSGGYTYASPRDADGKPRLTYIPKRMLKLFTSYRPRWLLEGLALGANLRWQDRVYTDRYRQGSLAVVDLMAQYEISRNLVATLNVNNVFDKTYYTDINDSGWYGEPRSAFLNLRYAF